MARLSPTVAYPSPRATDGSPVKPLIAEDGVSGHSGFGIKGRIVDESGSPVVQASVRYVRLSDSQSVLETCEATTDSCGNFEANSRDLHLEAEESAHVVLCKRFGSSDELTLSHVSRARLRTHLWSVRHHLEGHPELCDGVMNDVGVLTLPRGTRVRGSVFDESGNGVAGATILVGRASTNAEYFMLPPELEVVSVSTADGSFELPWRVNLQTNPRDPVWVVATTNRGYTSRPLFASEVMSDELSVSLILTKPGVALVCESSTGMPVGGATVRVDPTLNMRPGNRDSMLKWHDNIRTRCACSGDSDSLLTCTTGDDGIISVRTAAGSDECALCISAPGFMHKDVLLSGLVAGRAARVVLEPVAPLTVWGTVRTASGERVADAQVTLTYAQLSASWTVSANGQGEYSLTIEQHDGYQVTGTCAARSYARDHLVTTPDAGTLTSIEWNPTLGTQWFSISGHISDDGGRPIAHFEVDAQSVSDQRTHERRQTEEDGSFRFDDLDPAEYKISDGSSSTVWCLSESITARPGSSGLSFTASRRQDRSGQIQVLAVDAISGDQVLAIAAEITSADARATVGPDQRADGEPHIRLENGALTVRDITSGAWRAWVLGPGGREGCGDFTWGPDESGVRELVIAVGGRSHICARMPAEASRTQPLSGQEVYCRLHGDVPIYLGTGPSDSEGTKYVRRGELDSAGVCTFKDLIPGPYDIVCDTGSALFTGSVTTRAGESAVADLRATPTGSLRFVGLPPGRAVTVNVFDRDGVFLRTRNLMSSRQPGDHIESCLPVGRIWYAVLGDAEVRGEASIGAGETTTVQVPRS